jgi:hypothetical protein
VGLIEREGMDQGVLVQMLKAQITGAPAAPA